MNFDTGKQESLSLHPGCQLRKNSKVVGDRTTLQLPKHNGIETGDLQIRVAANPATNRLAGKILYSDAPYTSKVDPKLDVSSTFEYEVCLSFAG